MGKQERKLSIKRICAFLLILVVVLQSVLMAGQNYTVKGETLDGMGSSESSYTVYFDASKIVTESSFLENGVYLYAYELNEQGEVVAFAEQPVKMTKSDATDNLYELELGHPYTMMQFILGDSLDAAVKSEPMELDWTAYTAPCFCMSIVSGEGTEKDTEDGSEAGAESGTEDGSESTTETDTTEETSAVSVSVQMELYNLTISSSSTSEITNGMDGNSNEVSGNDTTGETSIGTDEKSELAVMSVEAEDDSVSGATAAFTPNSDYLYLNPAGMTG